MNETTTKNRVGITSEGVKKIQRLFEAGSEITDLAEDVLDELKEYSGEFLLGLQKSVKEAKSGKLKKLKTLKDLR
jgi:hypothetical protein